LLIASNPVVWYFLLNGQSVSHMRENNAAY